VKPLLVRVVGAAAVISALLVLFAPRPLAATGGLLLALVLPGMALTDALFRRRRELTVVERIALAPALSMATLILFGLLLYVCRVPLNSVSWAAATAGVTVLALLVPMLLPHGGERAPARETDHVAADPGATSTIPGVTDAHTVIMSVAPRRTEQEVAADEKAQRNRLIRQLLPLVLVAAILGGAAWLSVGTSLSTYNSKTVTQFAASPPAPPVNGVRTVVLKATGLQTADGPYRVTISKVTGASKASRAVPVPADGTWTETVTVPSDVRVTFQLFRASDTTTAYRTISVSEYDQ
jgi:hypothetical protein